MAGPVFHCGRHRIDLSTPRVMGIVNRSPDSFSDGGLLADLDTAVRAVERQVAEGAAIVDIGGESTRPGATPVPADVELSRLLPLLQLLRDAPFPISVDTRKPAVMASVLDAGASMINDIEGFASAAARTTVAASDCGVCVMHMQGEPGTMQADPHYDDVVAEVGASLDARTAALAEAGVARTRMLIDPGFGFGKTLSHNLALLARLGELRRIGLPILVGLSRKGMIGALTGRAVGERIHGSVAAALVAVDRGARVVRVHDVAATVDALAIWRAASAEAR